MWSASLLWTPAVGMISAARFGYWAEEPGGTDMKDDFKVWQ